MKFINIDNQLQKARRFISGASNVQEGEVKDPSKLAEILRSVLKRISDVEALQPAEAMEFEVNVGNSGTVSLQHNFHGAVRFYVTYWCRATTAALGPQPGVAPALCATEACTDDVLVLASFAAGRAVVRVEPAFRAIDVARVG